MARRVQGDRGESLRFGCVHWCACWGTCKVKAVPGHSKGGARNVWEKMVVLPIFSRGSRAPGHRERGAKRGGASRKRVS